MSETPSKLRFTSSRQAASMEKKVEAPVQEEKSAIADVQEIQEAPASVQEVKEETFNIDAVAVPVFVDYNEKTIRQHIKNKEFADAAIAMVKQAPETMVFLSELFSYSDAMAPTVTINEELGMRWQTRFFKMIVGVLRYEGEQHSRLFRIVLNFVAENAEGCFGWSHSNRFLENINLSRVERVAFGAITLMLREFCITDRNELVRRADKLLKSANGINMQAVIGEAAMQNIRKALRLS